MTNTPTNPPPPTTASTAIDSRPAPPVPPVPPTPPAPLQRPRRAPIEAADIRRRDLVAVLTVGVASDLALRRLPGDNVAGTVLFTTVALGFFATGRVTTPFVRRSLVAAIAFAVMLSVRTDPRLVAFNFIAAAGLLILAAAPPAHFFDTRPIQGLRNAVMALAVAVSFAVDLPRHAQAQQRRLVERGKARQTMAIVRGIILALPVVIVVGSLLASADAIFASFLTSVPISPLRETGHLALITIGCLATTTLFRLRATDTSPADRPSAPRLGYTEAVVGLLLLDALFVVFAVAQVIARVEPAFTSHALSEHARQGFFQLLWVAAITMTVLMSLRSMIDEEARHERAFRMTSLAAVALIYVIIVEAFHRLQLYIDSNGLTPLRFYSSAFSIWIGVAFTLVALRLFEWRATQAWMLPALATSGLIALAVLDVVNPEAIIARDALARNDHSVVSYVDQLSGDGLTVLVEGMDQLDPQVRSDLHDTLCSAALRRRRGLIDGNPGALDWNLGRVRGRDAIIQTCALDG